MLSTGRGQPAFIRLMPGSVATDFGRGSTAEAGWALTPGDVAEVVIDLLRSPRHALYSRVKG